MREGYAKQYRKKIVRVNSAEFRQLSFYSHVYNGPFSHFICSAKLIIAKKQHGTQLDQTTIFV